MNRAPAHIGVAAVLGAALSSVSPARAQIALFNDEKYSAWLRGVTLTGQMEAGIMANAARPADGMNFGDFFPIMPIRCSSTSLNLRWRVQLIRQ